MEVAMTVPAYLPYYVLGGSVAMIIVSLVGTHRALARANWKEGEREYAFRVVSIILVGWFLLATALVWFEAYRAALDGFPTIQYGLFIPIIIGLVLISRHGIVARVIDAIPQSWIVGVQVYRALGVIFLVLYFAGELPGLFALPAGIGDVAVGLSAPAVAAHYARNPEANGRAVAIWNIVGIADLAIAITTGFLTSPSQLQIYAFDAPNELIAAFPLALIPVFLVPLSIVLHVASLMKLYSEASASPAAA
jgi:hypothetical protein